MAFEHAKRLRTATLAAILLGAAAVTAPPSTASAEPSAADVEQARDLMDRGRNEYDRDKFADALRAFEAADEIMGLSYTGLWRAKALTELGRLIEARARLVQVANSPEAPDESSVLKAARAEAKSLQVKLADRIPSITFQLRGLAPGTAVQIRVDEDDVPAAALRLPRRVDPGRHTVRATAPGYRDVVTTVTIAEGEEKTVELQLSKDPSAPVAAPAAAADAPDDAGGGITFGPLFYTGVSMAGVGLIAGSVTGGLSLSAASSAKEGCVDDVCPTANEDDADRSVTLGHVSTASFAFAGVGAVLAVIDITVLSDSRAEDDAPDLGLQVGPTFLGVSGRF